MYKPIIDNFLRARAGNAPSLVALGKERVEASRVYHDATAAHGKAGADKRADAYITAGLSSSCHWFCYLPSVRCAGGAWQTCYELDAPAAHP